MGPKQYGYPRRCRLSRSELAALTGAGTRFRTEHLSALIAASSLPYCRVAVIVGKYGHTVVDRNRLRRRLREFVRLELLPGCKNADIALRALPTAYDAHVDLLMAEVKRIADKLVSPGA